MTFDLQAEEGLAFKNSGALFGLSQEDERGKEAKIVAGLKSYRP